MRASKQGLCQGDANAARIAALEVAHAVERRNEESLLKLVFEKIDSVAEMWLCLEHNKVYEQVKSREGCEEPSGGPDFEGGMSDMAAKLMAMAQFVPMEA